MRLGVLRIRTRWFAVGLGLDDGCRVPTRMLRLPGPDGCRQDLQIQWHLHDALPQLAALGRLMGSGSGAADSATRCPV